MTMRGMPLSQWFFQSQKDRHPTCAANSRAETCSGSQLQDTKILQTELARQNDFGPFRFDLVLADIELKVSVSS